VPIEIAFSALARTQLRSVLAVVLCVVAFPAAACSVASTSLAFGSIDPLQPVPTDSTATVSVHCPEPTEYSIAITTGSGSYGGRFMSSGSDQLEYQLFVDASRLSVWGDGTGGSVTVEGSADANGSNHTVYGRVPHQQFARPGVYSDVLLVTVTF